MGVKRRGDETERVYQGVHGPGIDGGLAKREHAEDSITNIVDVGSVADVSARIVANGGKIVQPKRTVPGVGYLATCLDTEGNLFGIMQRDESAR